MNVDPDLSWELVQKELEQVKALASSFGWEVTSDRQQFTVTVKMRSRIDQESYILEAKCDNYKAIPPLFEFIHPKTGERGNKSCYPQGSSYFHATPCICVQWNRKAYKTEGGPHGDWNMAGWMAARPGMTTLGDMFVLVQHEINKSDVYKGRMA